MILPSPLSPGACRATHQSAHVFVAVCSICMPPDGLQAQQPHSIFQPPQRHQPVHNLRAATHGERDVSRGRILQKAGSPSGLR